MPNRGYKSPHIYHIAHSMATQIHAMTFKLPKFEFYEEGSQIRRSSKAIWSNIVEGFARRRYKNDFLEYLIYALSSCDETREHLDTLYETKSLTDENLFVLLSRTCDELGRTLNKFIQAVDVGHLTLRNHSVK